MLLIYYGVRMGFARDSAVSSVVGTIMIIAVAIVAVATVLGWGLPYMQSVKEQSQVESVTTQLQHFNDLMKEVCREGRNASTIARIAIKDGDLYLESEGERLVIFYSMDNSDNYDFDVSGLENRKKGFKLDCTKNFKCTAQATWLDTGRTETCTPDIGEEFRFHSVIEGMVRINLTNEDVGGKLVGRIWVFDLGDVRYELRGNGIYNVVMENGGIITANSPTDGYLQDVFYWKNDDVLALKVYQIKVSDSCISGTATYRFVLKSNGTYLRENRNETTYNLKIQVFGDFRDAWIDYFVSNLGFKENGDTIYLQDYKYNMPLTFSLTQSICDISYGGIG